MTPPALTTPPFCPILIHYASFEHDSRYSDNVVENAYVDELTNFFGVLKGDEQPKWSFEKDLKAIELMDRIEKA